MRFPYRVKSIIRFSNLFSILRKMGYICTISTVKYRILASMTTFRKTSSFYPSNLILFILIESSKELYYCYIELWVQERNNHYFIFSVYNFPSYFIHTVRIHSPLPITPHQISIFHTFIKSSSSMNYFNLSKARLPWTISIYL